MTPPQDCCALSNLPEVLMGLMNFLQWPAMIITVLAAWCVASRNTQRRRLGFWLFLASNILWVTWGIYAHAYALVVLQVCLAATNIRGERRNATDLERAGH